MLLQEQEVQDLATDQQHDHYYNIHALTTAATATLGSPKRLTIDTAITRHVYPPYQQEPLVLSPTAVTDEQQRQRPHSASTRPRIGGPMPSSYASSGNAGAPYIPSSSSLSSSSSSAAALTPPSPSLRHATGRRGCARDSIPPPTNHAASSPLSPTTPTASSPQPPPSVPVPPFEPPPSDGYDAAGPRFSPSTQLVSVMDLQMSRHLELRVDARMDRGFFLTSGNYTCYRRNYFQLSACYAVDSVTVLNDGQQTYRCEERTEPTPCLVRVPRLAAVMTMAEGGAGKEPQRRIEYAWERAVDFSIGIHSTVDRSDSVVDLVQMTAKRDRGPQLSPHPRPCRPGGNLRAQSSSSSSSSAAPGALTPGGAGEVPQTVTFERLQFKQATANNGRRRSHQQYFVIHVDLLARLESGEMIRLATVKSAPLVVRGRSPGHYNDSSSTSTSTTTAAIASGNTSGASGNEASPPPAPQLESLPAVPPLPGTPRYEDAASEFANNSPDSVALGMGLHVDHSALGYDGYTPASFDINSSMHSLSMYHHHQHQHHYHPQHYGSSTVPSPAISVGSPIMTHPAYSSYTGPLSPPQHSNQRYPSSSSPGMSYFGDHAAAPVSSTAALHSILSPQSPITPMTPMHPFNHQAASSSSCGLAPDTASSSYYNFAPLPLPSPMLPSNTISTHTTGSTLDGMPAGAGHQPYYSADAVLYDAAAAQALTNAQAQQDDLYGYYNQASSSSTPTCSFNLVVADQATATTAAAYEAEFGVGGDVVAGEWMHVPAQHHAPAHPDFLTTTTTAPAPDAAFVASLSQSYFHNGNTAGSD
ncbi:hypothetical protein RI367_002679 [Sorochytrium milnesiophthora]